jgi:outer membrane biosynthesis protein TonB
MTSKSMRFAQVNREQVFNQPDFASVHWLGNSNVGRFFQRGPSRVNTALLLSLLAHTLLLSITLGGQTFGLPRLDFPWKEKRLEANDLRILLAPARPIASASAAPSEILPVEMARAVSPPLERPAVVSDMKSMAMPSPAAEQSEAAAVQIAPAPATTAAPSPEPVTTARTRPDVNLPIAPDAPTVRAPATSVAQNAPAPRSETPMLNTVSDAAQKLIDHDTQGRALEQTRLERERQSAERLRQAELTAVTQREAARQEQLRQDAARAEQRAKSEAARMEVERQELARQEGLRREAALQRERTRLDEQAQQEAVRQERERTEAARLNAARLEAARLEAARREAARQEQAKQTQLEAARQAQLDAARQDAIAQEAARQETLKQEAARQEMAKQAQVQREKAEQEAKREERLRAIGKQLNAEAAQRDAASNRPSATLLPTVSGLRRGWLLGRADPNNDLILYAETMSRKIETNMTFDMVREAVKQPHVRPTVTVAVRADGSVEKVTFVVSSGVVAIDEAIRKVVASQAPFPAFPPALARQYDVIEIRRSWIFDIAIRLQ